MPLVVHELTTDFSEVSAALDYLAGRRRSDGDRAARPVPDHRGFASSAWPLTRPAHRCRRRRRWSRPVVVDRAIVVLVLARRGTARERQAASLARVSGCCGRPAFLTFASPSLATIVPGLPNDHYHAFADPMVFVLVGMGAAALSARSAARRGGATVGRRDRRRRGRGRRVGWNARSTSAAGRSVADGGFPAAANRPAVPDGGVPAPTGGDAGARSVALRSLPDFKSTEAYGLSAGPRRRVRVDGRGAGEPDLVA